MTNYEEVNPGIWKPEKEGDSIEGVLVNKVLKDQSDIDTSNRYYIENKDGVSLVWGTKIIDDRMNFIDVGEKVKIIYKETTTNSKNQPLKIYQVLKEKKEEKE